MDGAGNAGSVPSPDDELLQQQQQQQQQHNDDADAATKSSTDAMAVEPAAAPSAPSVAEMTEKQQELKDRVRKYFFQLTQGCGRAICENPHCACNPELAKLAPNEAAGVSLRLATLHALVRLCTPAPPFLDFESLSTLVSDALENGNTVPLIRTIGQVFGSTESVNQCFLCHDARGIATSTSPGIDYEALSNAFVMIDSSAGNDALVSALERLAKDSRSLGPRLQNPSDLRHMIVLLRFPGLSDPSNYQHILGPACSAIASLNDTQAKTLIHWIFAWRHDEILKLLRLVQTFLSVRVLSSYSISEDPLIHAVLCVITRMHTRNKELNEPIVYNEFYNEVVCEYFETNERELENDFRRFVGDIQQGECFVRSPYLLTPMIKSKLLRLASQLEMEQRRNDALRRMMLERQMAIPYLVFKVTRHRVVQDALEQANQYVTNSPEDLRKQLKVKFIGEEGVDEGGVQKEFFQLIIRDLFDPKYGMFGYRNKTGDYWFESSSNELQEFHLIGLLLGLAIYNDVILDVHFPHVVYKFLMGIKPSFEDLKDVDEEIYNGLKQLLEYPGNDIEKVFMLNFAIQYTTIYDEVLCHELKADGASIAVTNENYREYVDLYSRWLLEGRVERQVAAFVAGFRAVCDGPLYQWFRVEELECLICGDPVLDFEDLQSVTTYDNGYSKDDQLIKDFWEIVHSLTAEQKKKFLFFCTGTDRAPIGGLKHIRFFIVKHGPDSDRLPQAHTCFNVLLLPNYSSKEKLQARLLTAIQNAEGFGML